MRKTLEFQNEPKSEINGKVKGSDCISVIVPCYNEGEVLYVLCNTLNEIVQSMPEVNFEFIFVDDGSKDNTLEIIRAIAQKIQG